MSKIKTNKPIRAEDLTAYERWELPNIEGGIDAINKARSAIVRKPVKPLTADDLEKIRQEAYQAGYEEGKSAGFQKGQQDGLALGKKQGHEEGFNQGLQDAQVKVDQSVAQLRQCLQNLSNPIEEQGHLVEQAVLNLSLAVSRAVIHRELKLDSSQVLSTIQQAIQNLPDSSKGIKVRLNPQDADYAKQARESFENSLEIIVDASINAGGCLVETSSQLIDYTIEKRFQKTVHAMLFEASKQDSGTIETSTSINELSDYSPHTLDEAEQGLLEAQSSAPSDEDASSETDTLTEPNQTDLPDDNAPEGDGHEPV